MESSRPKESETPGPVAERWQLKMFRRSLKKQQKLAALLALAGELENRTCLLITCGDNNGALNWHFKRAGGSWTWVDAEQDSLDQIAAVTGDPVHRMDKESPALEFPDQTFDLVMTIDVHEHIPAPPRVNRELARVVKPGGRVVVTTPNSDERKLANRIKQWIGMRPEDYGHLVLGYDIPELNEQLEEAGLEPYASSSYSRFFTEMVELMINYVYVKVLAGRGQATVEKGQIAPQTENQLQSVGKSYKIYSTLYPFILAISKLDRLIGFSRGYAVIVAARKAKP